MEGLGKRRRVTRAIVAALVAVLGAGSHGIATPVSAASEPIARWMLDEGSGTTASDEVGTADGAISGSPTWLTSDVAVGSSALALDGVNDKVTVSSSPAIEPPEALITLWVRGDPQDPPDAGEVILEKGAFACEGPSFGIYVADGRIRFSFRGPNGQQVNRENDDFGAVDLWDGNWHLLALSVRLQDSIPDSAVEWFSMDGFPYATGAATDALEGPQTTAIKYSGATHSELVLGGPVDSGCGGGQFHGDIDDVRIYADAFVAAGSLMPPVTVAISNLDPAVAHPSGPISSSVDLSPSPRWGAVGWQYFQGGNWIQCCGAQTYSDVDGHIESSTGLAPATVGSYDFRAYFDSSPPYADAIATSTLEVTPWPTTTTVSVAPDPKLPYTNVQLIAHVSGQSIPSSHNPVGSVKFYDTTPATPLYLGTGVLGANEDGVSGTSILTNVLGGGTHAIVAEFIGPDPVRAGSTSDPLDVVIGPATPFVYVEGPGGTVDANNPFILYAHFDSTPNYQHDATVTFKQVGSSTPICSLPVAGPYTPCQIPGQPIGSPQFYVEYSGNSDVAPKTTDPLTIQVVADYLRSSGVGVQYGTFYPVKDNYRDTVAIRGTRDEAIAVTIKIYKPSGALLTTKSIATDSGAYAYAWTGRTSSGSILPEGKYKVIQTLRDAGNNAKSVTSYVVLSKKKLVYATKTLTQYGSSLDAKGTYGAATVKIVSSTSSVTLRAYPDGSSWAGAGWEFTLPSATVYKSIVGRMYGRRTGGPGLNYLAGQRFDWCPYKATGAWNANCFQSLVSIPSTSGTTKYLYKSGPLSANFRSGRKVRLSVNTTGGTIYVFKVSVVVTYGILTY